MAVKYQPVSMEEGLSYQSNNNDAKKRRKRNRTWICLAFIIVVSVSITTLHLKYEGQLQPKVAVYEETSLKDAAELKNQGTLNEDTTRSGNSIEFDNSSVDSGDNSNGDEGTIKSEKDKSSDEGKEDIVTEIDSHSDDEGEEDDEDDDMEEESQDEDDLDDFNISELEKDDENPPQIKGGLLPMSKHINFILEGWGLQRGHVGHSSYIRLIIHNTITDESKNRVLENMEVYFRLVGPALIAGIGIKRGNTLPGEYDLTFVPPLAGQYSLQIWLSAWNIGESVSWASVPLGVALHPFGHKIVVHGEPAIPFSRVDLPYCNRGINHDGGFWAKVEGNGLNLPLLEGGLRVDDSDAWAWVVPSCRYRKFTALNAAHALKGKWLHLVGPIETHIMFCRLKNLLTEGHEFKEAHNGCMVGRMNDVSETTDHLHIPLFQILITYERLSGFYDLRDVPKACRNGLRGNESAADIATRMLKSSTSHLNSWLLPYDKRPDALLLELGHSNWEFSCPGGSSCFKNMKNQVTSLAKVVKKSAKSNNYSGHLFLGLPSATWPTTMSVCAKKPSKCRYDHNYRNIYPLRSPSKGDAGNYLDLLLNDAADPYHAEERFNTKEASCGHAPYITDMVALSSAFTVPGKMSPFEIFNRLPSTLGRLDATLTGRTFFTSGSGHPDYLYNMMPDVHVQGILNSLAAHLSDDYLSGVEVVDTTPICTQRIPGSISLVAKLYGFGITNAKVGEMASFDITLSHRRPNNASITILGNTEVLFELRGPEIIAGLAKGDSNDPNTYHATYTASVIGKYLLTVSLLAWNTAGSLKTGARELGLTLDSCVFEVDVTAGTEVSNEDASHHIESTSNVVSMINKTAKLDTCDFDKRESYGRWMRYDSETTEAAISIGNQPDGMLNKFMWLEPGCRYERATPQFTQKVLANQWIHFVGDAATFDLFCELCKLVSPDDSSPSICALGKPLEETQMSDVTEVFYRSSTKVKLSFTPVHMFSSKSNGSSKCKSIDATRLKNFLKNVLDGTACSEQVSIESDKDLFFDSATSKAIHCQSSPVPRIMSFKPSLWDLHYGCRDAKDCVDAIKDVYSDLLNTIDIVVNKTKVKSAVDFIWEGEVARFPINMAYCSDHDSNKELCTSLMEAMGHNTKGAFVTDELWSDAAEGVAKENQCGVPPTAGVIAEIDSFVKEAINSTHLHYFDRLTSTIGRRDVTGRGTGDFRIINRSNIREGYVSKINAIMFLNGIARLLDKSSAK